MNSARRNIFGKRLLVIYLLLVTANHAQATDSSSASAGVKFSNLIVAIRTKAKGLEGSSGMRQSFQSFTATNRLTPANTSYSDYVVSRLIFEATRDAGFWNLHWKITNLEPNSDNIWRQWKTVRSPSVSLPTASAECDELSALYAFMAGRAGIRGVG